MAEKDFISINQCKNTSLQAQVLLNWVNYMIIKSKSSFNVEQHLSYCYISDDIKKVVCIYNCLFIYICNYFLFISLYFILFPLVSFCLSYVLCFSYYYRDIKTLGQIDRWILLIYLYLFVRDNVTDHYNRL